MSRCFKHGPDCDGDVRVVVEKVGASYGGCTIWACRVHAVAYRPGRVIRRG